MSSAVLRLALGAALLRLGTRSHHPNQYSQKGPCVARINVTDPAWRSTQLTPESWSHTVLYRAYDADSRLLYIGISGDPVSRWHQHSRKALWWPQASWIDYCGYPTEYDALDAERHAIRDEQPLFNKRSANRRGRCEVSCRICTTNPAGAI